MYQQYQFDREVIARAAENSAASLAEAHPGDSPEAFAAKVIAERLRSAPGGYLQYGPYWWSVKQALRGEGHDFGDVDSAELRAAYGSGLTAHQALVAGEQFREYYRAHLMAGTTTFALGGQDETVAGEYTLLDINMETLRLGRANGGLARMNAAYGQAIREPDEPILDDVQVRFEEGGELWTAVVDAKLGGRGLRSEEAGG
ncbi:hypothetical protein [Ideonella sp.]|uniref:hypothetical protein n=1 Tax=Ideonella sp. TaxID=1929293 RepID=UPI0035B0AF4B